MILRDRVQLLFGPYTAPPLRRGDRASCLLRDCDVVITSWSSGRIPWPRCRPVDGYRGGGWGLLLDEELARAVRHESAAAVGHWWGASPGTVQRWRRALGVGRTDNEGSRRLIRAAAEAGGEALRARGLTPEERERHRQNAKRLNLAQYLPKGYVGPWWTARQRALLGKLPDEEVAARVGRTVDAVRRQRYLLGIPNPDTNRWSEDEDDLVRTLWPKEAAARTGRSLSAVYSRRLGLGLPDGRVNNGRRPAAAKGPCRERR
jgi:hypothetical protein